jgi:hypothetical protein
VGVGAKGQYATVQPRPKPPTPSELEDLALRTCPPGQLLLTCVANLDEACAAAVLDALLDGCEKAVRTRDAQFPPFQATALCLTFPLYFSLFVVAAIFLGSLFSRVCGFLHRSAITN